jgi:hypothetical protein
MNKIKNIIFLLSLLSYTHADFILDYNDDDNTSGKDIIIGDFHFDIFIYPNNSSCLNDTQRTLIKADFDTPSGCSCFNSDYECYQMLTQSDLFLNYNWTSLLKNNNLSYFNVSECIIEKKPYDNCFSCKNNTLLIYKSFNKDICLVSGLIFILISVFICAFIIIITYWCVKRRRIRDYQPIAQPKKKKYVFFTRN